VAGARRAWAHVDLAAQELAARARRDRTQRALCNRPMVPARRTAGRLLRAAREPGRGADLGTRATTAGSL
jgi:hypothetical protein